MAMNERRARLHLAALASAPEWARRYTTELAPTWGLAPLTTVLAALVEELVTHVNPAPPRHISPNTGHAPHRLTLTLRHRPGTVFLTVWTSGTLVDEQATSLPLIDKHARRWHYGHPPGGGTTIHAEITLAGPAETSATHPAGETTP